MEKPEQEIKKKVDASYKDSVEKEKKRPEKVIIEEKKSAEDYVLPGINFPMFVTSIGMQAMMSLGEVENPLTKKKEENLDHAKYSIDTLLMLKEKTKGNLDSEEGKVLEELIYQLQMKYIEKNKFR